MSRLLVFALLAIGAALVSGHSLNSPSIRQISPLKTEDIGGFVMFRVMNGKMEFLLLEKDSEPGDWSPPKGHVEDDEIPVNAAYRETREETALQVESYQPFLGYEHYFEYKTNGGDLKKVTLWPAHLIDTSRPIVISPESRDYTWADITRTLDIIKPQYKSAYTNVILQLNCHFTSAC